MSTSPPASPTGIPPAPPIGGLSTAEAERRLREHGPNTPGPAKKSRLPALLLAQFTTPIILILIGAAGLSFALGDRIDASIILAIVSLSSLLGFWQEKKAGDAVASLLALVRVRVTALRDGRETEVPLASIVPGDLVLLRAGDLVPADGRLVESRHLLVDEASLTGETFPAEKDAAAPVREPAALPPDRLFLGTHVVSGTARLEILATGPDTRFGTLTRTLGRHPPPTEFERGVRQFGYFLLEVTLLMLLAIFALNVWLARPVMDSLLFSLALAVGLTPQLLPAIVSVTLARGAKEMAARRVVVKRLAAMENFGSMTVLCSDKTGTLTEGRMKLEAAVAPSGAASGRVLELAALNAFFQAGYVNPLDPAILAAAALDAAPWRKLDEEPYDFVRRRMSVLVTDGSSRLLITKGAVPNVLVACDRREEPDGPAPLRADGDPWIETQLRQFAERGWRVLAVACKRVAPEARDAMAETAMTFAGLLAFSDPIRPEAPQTIAELRRLGIALKIVTGDHHLVALDIGRQSGLAQARCLTGAEIRGMSDAALARQARDTEIFAEIEPNQKERLVLALRKSGEVVGYLGDGINDVSALHAADVGVSVAGAADAATEAADIVLLDRGLAVLAQGIRAGRQTFANTLKYVFMATSANFGNMFSMAAASLFLPFLPLLPKQILLLNLLTDLPEMTIATDAVDEEWLLRPQRWDVRLIRRFMLSFGLLSSAFDLLTFLVLLHLPGLSAAGVRSGWFVESVLAATGTVLVIRSARPLGASRPSRPLLLASAAVMATALALPFCPWAAALGLAPLPAQTLGWMMAIVATCVLCTDLAKRAFYPRFPSQ